jgi:hypothetical protein
MVCDVSITRFFGVSIRRMWQELFPANVSLCGNNLLAHPHPRRTEPVPYDDDPRDVALVLAQRCDGVLLATETIVP